MKKMLDNAIKGIKEKITDAEMEIDHLNEKLYSLRDELGELLKKKSDALHEKDEVKE